MTKRYSDEFESYWQDMLWRHKWYKYTQAKDAAYDAFRAGKKLARRATGNAQSKPAGQAGHLAMTSGSDPAEL
jgi:hypothetical protein